jgi:hypothetical protein
MTGPVDERDLQLRALWATLNFVQLVGPQLGEIRLLGLLLNPSPDGPPPPAGFPELLIPGVVGTLLSHITTEIGQAHYDGVAEGLQHAWTYAGRQSPYPDPDVEPEAWPDMEAEDAATIRGTERSERLQTILIGVLEDRTTGVLSVWRAFKRVAGEVGVSPTDLLNEPFVDELDALLGQPDGDQVEQWARAFREGWRE